MTLVQVHWYVTGGQAPQAGRFECDMYEVAAELREPLSGLPPEAIGALRLGLTAELPEALRTNGRWRHAAGALLVVIEQL